jgi:acetyl-CoA carboxylase carboxyl transferase subunit beta
MTNRLTLAVERATGERLPLVVAPASGGTRMREGTLASCRWSSQSTGGAA